MAVSVQTAALESTFQRIARIMAQRYGVTVRIEGAKAGVDLTRDAIVLPSLADDESLDDDVLDGFLDHECAHVIHTDREVYKELQGEFLLFSFWNNVEDVWIERAMGREYVGCRQNLNRLNAQLFARIEKGWEKLDALGRLYYALERCYRGDYDSTMYAMDPLIGAMIGELDAEIKRGRLCADSHEAASIARAVYAKIKDLADPQPQSNQGGSDADDDGMDSDDSDGSGGDSGDDGDSKSGAGSEDSSGGSGDSGKAQPRASGSGSEGDGADDEGQKAAAAAARKERLKEARKQAKAFLKEEKSGFQKPLDAEGLVNEMLTEFLDWGTDRDPDRYVVFSEAYDTEVTYSPQERLALTEPYARLRNELNQYVGNLANVLEMTLHAEAESRWVGGARRGRHFDRRRLSHWAEGSEDDRIFRYLEEGQEHDTAVCMLWDCSGSMGSSQSMKNKAALARIAAIAFHEALTRCRIAHEVLGFNTGGGHSEALSAAVTRAQAAGEEFARYSRVDELDARMVFVPFGCQDGRALVEITGGAANRDGECVLWAARRLAQRPEKRKILIVGSDGHPQGARYHRTERSFLREVVTRVITTGIEVYALGIMDSAVRQYYPRWQVIHNVQDLPRAVLTQLAQSLPAQSLGGRQYARLATV